jgi:hypothetical protein
MSTLILLLTLLLSASAAALPNPSLPNPDRQGGGLAGIPNPDRQGGGCPPALLALEQGNSPQALTLALDLLDVGGPDTDLAVAILLDLAPHVALCQTPALWSRSLAAGASDDALAGLLQLHLQDRTRCPDLPPLPGDLQQPDQWQVQLWPGASPLLAALTTMPQSASGPITTQPRWALHSRTLVQAQTTVCLPQAQQLLWFWDGGAPGALWVQNTQVLVREPGRSLQTPQHARLTLEAGCHNVTLLLAPDPGRGQAFLAYLPTQSHPNPDRQGGGAARIPNPDRQGWGAPAVLLHLLAGDDLAARRALDQCSASQPGCFTAARVLFSLLGQGRPLEQRANGLLGTDSPGACPAHLWMLQQLRGEDQDTLKTWLDLWPQRCQDSFDARLFRLELELEEDRLESAAQGYQDLLTALAPGTHPKDLRLEALAARLPAAESAQPLPAGPLSSGPQDDPEAQWALGDANLAGGDAALARDSLAKAAHSPVAGDDLRWRATAALGAQRLLALAQDPEDLLGEYRASNFAPPEDAVLVLDEVLLLPGPHGQLQVLETSIWHLRSTEATTQWADLELPQDAHLLTLELRKPDGTRLAPAYAGPGEAISLKGLEADDLVIFSVLHDTRPSLELGSEYCLPEHRFAGPGVPVFRSVLGVVGPELPRLRVLRYHGAPAARQDGDVWWFQAGPLEAAPSGALELNSRGALPRVQLCTSGMSLGLLRDILTDSALRLLRPGPSVEALALKLAPRPDPVAAALAASVQALEPDSGLLFARSVDRMLAQGEGHPALLLTALLQRLGLDATLVLVAPPGAEGLAPLAPAPEAFSEALVLLRHGPREVWLDPWSKAALPGLVRPFLEGRPALLLDSPWQPLLTRVPLASPSAHQRSVTLRLAATPDGSAHGDARLDFNGLSASAACRNLSGLEDRELAAALQGYLEGTLPGLQVQAPKLSCSPGRLKLKGGVTLPAPGLSQPLELTLPAANLGDRAPDQQATSGPWLLEGLARLSLDLQITVPPRLQPFELRVATGRWDFAFGTLDTSLVSGPGKLRLRQAVFARESELSPAQGPSLAALLEACASQGHATWLPTKEHP